MVFMLIRVKLQRKSLRAVIILPYTMRTNLKYQFEPEKADDGGDERDELRDILQISE
jgi:hypothetical protein